MNVLILVIPECFVNRDAEHFITNFTDNDRDTHENNQLFV